jgi:hypothetical protein
MGNAMVKAVPVPVSGGLILSYKCSAACRHCMYACSPRWPADWISDEDLDATLGQLARTIEPSPRGPEGISLSHGLHFTGGEPFLDFERLCRAVRVATELGIPSTFVETNAAWCVDDAKTREKLKALRAAGLKGIMVSVNPFFLEFVPFERTLRAIRYGLEVFERNVAVYQLEYFHRFAEWGIRGTMTFEDFLRREAGSNPLAGVEFFVMGRAPYALGSFLQRHLPTRPARRFLAEGCQPPFLRDWHNHFDCYGNYVPGFCAGISFGDCRRLDALLREGVRVEERPVLALLIEEDLEGVLRLAVDLGYRESPAGYLSRCHLCVDIRRHLAATGEFAELAPRQFYEQLDPAPPRPTPATA